MIDLGPTLREVQEEIKQERDKPTYPDWRIVWGRRHGKTWVGETLTTEDYRWES